ncbi:hypothetical protein ACJZ2D_014050 [Fusarium nematophilum]
MSAKCVHCSNLSIKSLVDLANTQFKGCSFAYDAYYQHHASFAELETSALGGCDFCCLILDSVKQSPYPDDTWRRWPSSLQSGTTSGTMYDFAKQLDSSDVKLCINADHIYADSELQDSQVLDTLMVQLGRATEISEYGQAKQVEGYQIGRFQVDNNLWSDTNYSIAREWLKDCRHNHPSCLTSQLPELPAQVLDVKQFLDSGTVRLIITRRQQADYVALSHCWGGIISPLLTTNTMRAFQKEITCSDLPANFQDAFTITYNLGLRYIWIDSLCIIQNSKEDWAAESKKMGQIYRDSTITISAMASSGSKEGILKQLPSSSMTSIRATVKIFPELDSPLVTIQAKDDPEEYLESLFKDGPLSKRGWTLQEYILPPRQLFIGERKIYWRCPNGYVSSDGLPPGMTTPRDEFRDLALVLYSEVLKDHHDEPLDKGALLKDYYNLVKTYSRRTLTYGADKLPAFLSISQCLSSVFGEGYLAGIWLSDVQPGLLWCRMSENGSNSGPGRAPSWSWAATDDVVLWSLGSVKLEPDTRVPKSELLSFDMTPEIAGNPHGQVPPRGVYDNLGYAGFDKNLVGLRWEALRIVQQDEGDYVKSIIQTGGKSDAAIQQEYNDNLEQYSQPHFLLAMIIAHEGDSNDETIFTAQCLILREAQGKEAEMYERAGWGVLYQLCFEWLQTWEF